MKAILIDLNDDNSPLNGSFLASVHDFKAVLTEVQDKLPFVCQLQFKDGCRFDIGVAEHFGFVQHTPADGLPPYRMATTPSSRPIGESDIEFPVGGTATPIDTRYCIPLPLVEHIVAQMIEVSNLGTDVVWEEV